MNFPRRLILIFILALLSSQACLAGVTITSWNLGWHLSQEEATTWIQACDKRYELNTETLTWMPSDKDNASTGWQIDWRPRDERVKLPWTIENLPPCNVYQDSHGKVVPVTLASYQKRVENIGSILNALESDVIAFQEVSGEASIREALGVASENYEVCSFTGYSVQRLAFAWKKNLSTTKGACDTYDPLSLPNLGSDRRPRPGLRLSLTIDGMKTAFLNVHLKSSCVSPLEESPPGRGQLEGEQRDCKVLQQQIPALENWFETTSIQNDRFMVLGDFNRDLWHEVEKGKTTPVRVDGSDPASPLVPAVKVRFLQAEVNDKVPVTSALRLASPNCMKTKNSQTLCIKAKTVRLSVAESQSLVTDMGCRNPVGLDQMLVSDTWTGFSEPLKTEKISIVPFGETGVVIGNNGIAVTTLAASDHCPMVLKPLNP